MAKEPPTPASRLPVGAWRTVVPVRFSHCDPAGIVYFPRYFDIINGVNEDWFSEALGIPHHHLIRDRRVGLGPVHAEADFYSPGFLGDRLAYTMVVEHIGGASFALKVHVHREDEPVLLARLVIVTTSLEVHRTMPIPDDLRAALEAYQEGCR